MISNTGRLSIRRPLRRSFTDLVRRNISGSSRNDGSSSVEQLIDDDKKRINILEHFDRIAEIPLQDVRNFAFIAHVDHGKSSLSSRILELAGNQGRAAQKVAWDAAQGVEGEETDASSASSASKPSESPKPDHKEDIELLDTLSVEQERGITVKASAASLLYPHPSAVGPTGTLLINLYDTPGHADFGKEVLRSLQFIQGACLLIDATQGVQAQTWSVYQQAQHLSALRATKGAPLALLLALTKVDLDLANPLEIALQASEWLDHDPDTVLYTSARNRVGISQILDVVGEQVPPPPPLDDQDILRAQVVDSWYDDRGVNCLLQIVEGSVAETDRVSLVGDESKQSYSVQECGILLPRPLRTKRLTRGQMGYCRFGLKDPRQALPGTVLLHNEYISKSESLALPQLLMPGVDESETNASSSPSSVLYASVHPQEVGVFDDLCNAVNRLALNDTGLEVTKTGALDGAASESGGPFLGPGLRVGFQGLLHVEVFQQRLRDEFEIEAVITPPKVPYRVTFLPSKSSSFTEPYSQVVEDLRDWPDASVRYSVEEPIVFVKVMAPVEYAGAVMDLLQRKRGTNLETKTLDESKWLFTANVPWAEVVIDFHDTLKNVTAGYGSMDTQPADPPLAVANLKKVDIMLNGESVDPLSFVCHASTAQAEARTVALKLKKVLPRQQFVTVIQAQAGGKIIAAERIPAYRKDVLTKGGKTVGGGDQTRKMKLLQKQKKGKKRMQQSGRVTLSQAAFNSVISRSSS